MIAHVVVAVTALLPEPAPRLALCQAAVHHRGPHATFLTSSCDRRALLLAGVLSAAPVAASELTEADVAYAVADSVACRSYVRTVLNLVRYDAYPDARQTMRGSPFSSISKSTQTLIDGPSGLDEAQRAIVRDSAVVSDIAAFVAAVQAEDGARAREIGRRAISALDSVLAECKAAGLL